MSKRTLPVATAMALREMWEPDRPKAINYARELRRRGYPLAALADALGITRQRMHQLERAWQEADKPIPRNLLRGLPMPPPLGTDRTKVVPPPLGVRDAALVIGLWHLSGRVRGRTRPDTLEARSVPELDEHLRSLRAEGHTLAQLADATGIPYAGLRRRSGRIMRRVHGPAPEAH